MKNSLYSITFLFLTFSMFGQKELKTELVTLSEQPPSSERRVSRSLQVHHTALATQALIEFVKVNCSYPTFLEDNQMEGECILIFTLSNSGEVSDVNLRLEHNSSYYSSFIKELTSVPSINIPVSRYYGAEVIEIQLKFTL